MEEIMSTRFWFKKLFILLLTISTLTACQTQQQAGGKKPHLKEINLYVATDLHYFSPTLHDNGNAFHKYIAAGNSKLLNYSDQLTDALVDTVIQDRPEALILSGDLTNNGEKSSHVDLAQKLKRVQDAGTPVYVIPGNHDISNPWARKFKGDGQYKTPYISPEDFANIYEDFGYRTALTRDKDSLSYVAEVSDDLWLLMLDTSKYENNVMMNIPQTDGQLGKSTLKWIKQYGEQAKKKNIQIITVMHHNLLDHSDLLDGGFTLNNAEDLTPILQNSNVPLVLSGHIHIQDIATNGKIYDIATSANSVYPHHYGKIHFDADTLQLTYAAEQTPVAKWSKEKGINNPDLNNFDTYAHHFFYENSSKRIAKTLDKLLYSIEDKQDMAKVSAAVDLLYFSGASPSKELLQFRGLTLWEQASDEVGFSKKYVLDRIHSGKISNFLSLTIPKKE